MGYFSHIVSFLSFVTFLIPYPDLAKAIPYLKNAHKVEKSVKV